VQTLDDQRKNLNPGESFYTTEVAANYDDIRKKDRYWNWEDMVLEKSFSLLNSGDNIVDCPFGTGRFLPLYKKLNIVGIDISEDMLLQAKKKVNEKGMENKVKLFKTDLNEFKSGEHNLKALVSFRLLHLISPDKVEEYTRNLAKMPSQYIFLQVFSVHDFAPMNIISRLGKVLFMGNASLKDKLVYLARTAVHIQKKIFPQLNNVLKKSSAKNMEQTGKDVFCDVTYYHELARIQKTLNEFKFKEKERFELMDLTHVKTESATRATALLVLKKISAE